MGIFTNLVAPAVTAVYAPWDDFWYQKAAPWASTQSGYPVNPESSMRLAAVAGCVSMIADMIGSLPLILYRRREHDGKDRATTHPLYNLLRRRPNVWQTAKEWRTMGTAHLLLRGNFYNQIVFDGRSSIAQVVPLHPDRMTVRQLDSGRRGYSYLPPSGGPRVAFTQDEILHVMGFSLDGIVGCSVIEFARESIGTAQMQEGFAARFWSQGAELGGVLEHPASLNPETRDALRKSWREAHASGLATAHNIALLEGGVKFTPIGVKGRDAQYIESRNFGVADICRFFKIMPYWLGVEGRWATGTGIEQLMIQFVKVTLMPWFESWEQAIYRDLIDDDRYFAEFLVDALLRGDTTSRYQAYATAIMNGIMSENEVRVRENLNPYPGLDVPQRSVNQGRGGNPTLAQPGSPRAPKGPPPGADQGQPGVRARVVIENTAARLVRKEVAAICKWAPRLAADPAGWRTWVADFYDRYTSDLEATLAISSRLARVYCDGHRQSLLRIGVKVAEEWEREQPRRLAELALMEASHG